MKRAGYLLEGLLEPNHLKEAFWAAAKGKRWHPEVLSVAKDCDAFCTSLRDEVLQGLYAPQPFHRFVIHDPKRREIAAPAFRDQVLHHDSRTA